MANFPARLEALKRQVGGNREKMDFEWTFGATREERMHVTPPGRPIIRILSELNFAIQLSAENGGKFDAEIERALTHLEGAMARDGVLTRSACLGAEQALLPLSPAAKEYEVIFASHAHIDMNWMWGWQETVAATIATFRTVLDMMREYPEFTFSQSQTSVYKIIDDYAPEMKEEMLQRIAEGRWEVTAAAWVETDKNMPDTESLIRHIEYTRNYLEEHWGISREKLNLDFSPDTFGHSRFVPEINTFGGVKYYYHCRGLQDDLTLYRYKCPSGAEILMYKEPYWYNSGVTPDCGTGIFGLSKRCAGLKTGLIVYGVGDHGGGPSRRDIERVLEMQGWPVFPTMKFGTVREYFAKAEAVREKLPVVDHELNAIFAGCYTTQSRIKRGNRKTEQALLDAEKLAAFRTMADGTPAPTGRLEKAWQGVLFTHFHDILTGSCVQESREHAMGLFADSLAHAQQTQSASATALSRMTDTSAFLSDEDIRFTQAEGAGVGFGISNHSGVPNPERSAGKTRIYTVFNNAPVAKRECVELTVWDYTGDLRRLEAVDSQMNPLPLELLDREMQTYWDHRYVRVLVKVEVAAMGYATIALREKPVTDYPTFYLSAERTESPKGDITLENEFLRAKIDGRSGMLLSLVDKTTGKEQLSAPAGLCVVDTEKATSDAWKIGRYLGVTPVDHTLRMEPISGNLRHGVRMEHQMLHSSVKTEVTLEEGARALKYSFSVDWSEAASQSKTHPVLIYRMPLKDKAEQVLMDVPAGCAVRTARAMDLPGLSFAAALTGEKVPYIVTDCKYGYRLDRSELIATLINTAGGPDPYPERGIHAIELYLGVEKADEKVMKETAAALIKPMFGIPCAAHPGKLPMNGAFLDFRGDTAVLDSFSWADGAYRARISEMCGKGCKVTLALPANITEATLTDLEGHEIGAAEISGDCVSFEIGAYRLAQLNLK
ncbi:MAG: glycoside hydrolase family 38 C-terminal domain-containing protein [Eubacteriales bacterium]|nr:hypothetical protein [Clostridiales bacterium]MDD6932484.1 glycoside hydrolase family 38 C-terminal domain-containing protein [Eubacteriales bacterium]MDY2601489.1 glycoside hydrolase family 38 C-terminal domain-containing protein [Eubacteriales bacterium]